MFIEKKIKCQNCNTCFVPRTRRNKWCSRKCFFAYYRKKLKISQFPNFICSNCGKVMQLDFHPKMNEKRWENFECPHCKHKQNKAE
jgi:DNA-directed RNA polymerase subunit RPC12/RpoP